MLLENTLGKDVWRGLKINRKVRGRTTADTADQVLVLERCFLSRCSSAVDTRLLGGRGVQIRTLPMTCSRGSSVLLADWCGDSRMRRAARWCESAERSLCPELSVGVGKTDSWEKTIVRG
jgi:hypothetical protein